MNYKMHYDALMQKARVRSLNCYSERHHVIPRCIGGSNQESNVVRLTPEEHYTAHLLLAKIHRGEIKLIFAAHRMTSGRSRSNKLYGWIRRLAAEALSNNNPMSRQEERLRASKVMKERNKKLGNPMKRPEVVEKRMRSESGIGKKVVCIEERKEFHSRSEAARWLSSFLGKKASAQCLSNALKKESSVAYGFHWRYA